MILTFIIFIAVISLLLLANKPNKLRVISTLLFFLVTSCVCLVSFRMSHGHTDRGICDRYEKVDRDYQTMEFESRKENGNAHSRANATLEMVMMDKILSNVEHDIVDVISSVDFLSMDPTIGDSLVDGLIPLYEVPADYIELYNYQCFFDKLMFNWMRCLSSSHAIEDRDPYLYSVWGLMGLEYETSFNSRVGAILANKIYDNPETHGYLYARIKPYLDGVWKVMPRDHKVFISNIFIDWKNWCADGQIPVANNGDESSLYKLQLWTMRRIDRGQFAMADIIEWINLIQNEILVIT